MFPLSPGEEFASNVLGLCLQPDEGIHLRFEAKVPGTANEMRPVDMTFHYADAFGEGGIPGTYEHLLLDALLGDAALFIRSDAIELSWRLIDSILEAWENGAAPPLTLYEPGSWGPTEAEALLARDDHAWLRSCGVHYKASVATGTSSR